MAKQISVGIGGVVKTVKSVHVGVGGVVKTVKSGKCGIGGAVKTFFEDELVVYDGSDVLNGASYYGSNTNYVLLPSGLITGGKKLVVQLNTAKEGRFHIWLASTSSTYNNTSWYTISSGLAQSGSSVTFAANTDYIYELDTIPAIKNESVSSIRVGFQPVINKIFSSTDISYISKITIQ